MQFSDVATKQGLIQDITFHLGVDINAYTIEDRTRNINERFRQVWAIIFNAYGGWKFIDDNVSDTSTGVPYADQNITSGTSLYALPASALAVDEVTVLNSGGTREYLRPLTVEEFKDRGGDATFSSNGVPHNYLLQGDILRILPTPNYTLSNALRVYFSQGISTFATTDTTKTPGFASPFHRALSVGASLDYAIARGLSSKVSELKNLWEWYAGNPDTGKRGAIADFYAERFRDRKPNRINPSRDHMRWLT